LPGCWNRGRIVHDCLAVHFVHAKYVFVIPHDHAAFVIQVVACSLEAIVRDDVDDEVRNVGHLTEEKNGLWIVPVVDRDVTLAVPLYVEYSVSCKERFRFAGPKRSGYEVVDVVGNVVRSC